MIYIDLKNSDIQGYLCSIPYKCPICGYENFTILSFDNNRPSIRDTEEILLEYKEDIGRLEIKPAPLKNNRLGATVHIICKRCGHVTQFNFFALCEAIDGFFKEQK